MKKQKPSDRTEDIEVCKHGILIDTGCYICDEIAEFNVKKAKKYMEKLQELDEKFISRNEVLKILDELIEKFKDMYFYYMAHNKEKTPKALKILYKKIEQAEERVKKI